MKNLDLFQVQIDRSAESPSYLQLSDQIIQLIQSDVIQIGEFLPTENQICELSGLSRMTVRRAVQRLNQLGMIDAVRGRGTFVIAKQPKGESIRYSIGFALRPERYIEEDPFYSQVLMGVTQEAQKQRIHLAFIKGEHVQDESTIHDHYSILQQLSGLIIAGQMQPAFLDYVQSVRLPSVFLNFHSSDYPFDSVTSDQKEIGSLLAVHLVQLGHRHCLYLSGEPDNIAYEQRLAGFQEVFLQSPHAQLQVMKGGKQSDSGREMIRAALEKHLSFTAVAAGNDMIAIGAMNELQDRGIQIPKDISICGIDNVTTAEMCRPALTTVHIAKQEMGMRALQLLLERLIHPRRVKESVILGVHLIVRQSTGPVSKQDPSIIHQENVG